MIITSLMKKALSPFMGRVKYQKYFDYLNRISLEGMNIGRGANPKISGEENMLKTIKKDIDIDNCILFDVGANVGKYCQVLHRIFGEHSRIFAFEPSASAFEVLGKNTTKLRNIELFRFGFGQKVEEVTLFSDREASGLASIYKRKLDHFNIEMNVKETIQLYTLDKFCQEHKVERIDLLKLDVEGNEINVLKGAENILRQQRIKRIQFEFGGCNIDSKTFFQDFYYLLAENYRIFRILKDGHYEITAYDERFETFRATNYLAVLK